MNSIYCDIDSTINNHRERIKRNTVGGWPGTIIDPKAFTRDEIMKDLPIPEALEALNKLSKVYSINFITSREWDYPEGLITKEWLDRHGFKYDTLTIVRGHEEKFNVLKKHNATVYIDDFTIYQEREEVSILHPLMLKMAKAVRHLYRYDNNWREIYEQIT